MRLGEKIIESYSPPLPRWRVWNEIEQVQFIAMVLLSGASEPIGHYRDKNGSTFYQSMDGCYVTERDAVVAFIEQHEVSMGGLVKQIEQATEDLSAQRINHAALVRRLNTLPIPK